MITIMIMIIIIIINSDEICAGWQPDAASNSGFARRISTDDEQKKTQ